MSNQGLFLGRFQLEVISQEDPELLLDFFGFRFWANEAQERVIRVAHVTESSVVWIVGIT
jgi:hypothetical protein